MTRPSRGAHVGNQGLSLFSGKHLRPPAEVALVHDKADMRRTLLGRRAAMAAELAESLSGHIGVHLRRHIGDAVASPDGVDRLAVGLYAAVRGEVRVDPLGPWLRAHGWRTAYPRVLAPGVLTLVAVADDTPWITGRYGIPEPASDQRLAPQDCAILLVPGVAFDWRGHRLGYGGGYYDQLLADERMQALRVGVAFACQVVDALPVEPHDQPVHRLVTERGVVDCGRPGGEPG